jgi:hypothetical protein
MRSYRTKLWEDFISLARMYRQPDWVKLANSLYEEVPDYRFCSMP